jgi:CYTH domain-containing protein
MRVQIERERRYLLDHIPPGSRLIGEITQGYFVATTFLEIRLRTGAINSSALKLRFSPQSRIEIETSLPSSVALFLMRLTRWKISKLRYTAEIDGRQWDIDEYLGRHVGLISAETEHGPSESIPTPLWALIDVSGNSRYTNKTLAQS